MDEAYLKRGLVKALKKSMPGAVVLRHEDIRTPGIPDISSTYLDRTTWVEAKYDRPARRSKTTALQLLRLREMGGLLVTYSTDKDGSIGCRLDDVSAGLCLMALRNAGSFSSYHDEVAKMVRLRGYTSHLAEEWPPTELEQVREFHRKFGVPVGESPALDAEAATRRVSHLMEEVCEMQLALADRDLPDVADAVADVVYVALGLALNLGLPWRELFSEVHRANMEKVLCPAGEGKYGSGHKFGIKKPAGWRAPDVALVLRRAGWQG